QDANLGGFIRDAVARNIKRKWADLLGLQIGGRVVLRDNHTARLYVSEQLGLPGCNPFLRIVGANTDDNGVETFEIFEVDLGTIEDLHIITDLLKALRNVVAGAGDITD